jgi:hypothetical protein
MANMKIADKCCLGPHHHIDMAARALHHIHAVAEHNAGRGEHEP